MFDFFVRSADFEFSNTLLENSNNNVNNSDSLQLQNEKWGLTKNGEEIARNRVYSVGGGTIEVEGEASVLEVVDDYEHYLLLPIDILEMLNK